MRLRYTRGMHKMNKPESDEALASVEDTEAQNGQEFSPRRPKIALRFNKVETYLPLTSYSERLLRQIPGQVELYQCTDPDDPAATARALTSFAMRLKQSIGESFSIQTQQALLNWTEYETVNKKSITRDRSQRVIRCVVTCNPLYNAWLKKSMDESAEAAELAQTILAEGPRPAGRPRIHPVKPKPPIDPANPQKRGRGRPRKNPLGQDTLL